MALMLAGTLISRYRDAMKTMQNPATTPILSFRVSNDRCITAGLYTLEGGRKYDTRSITRDTNNNAIETFFDMMNGYLPIYINLGIQIYVLKFLLKQGKVELF